jgi:hypothetical protein
MPQINALYNQKGVWKGDGSQGQIQVVDTDTNTDSDAIQNAKETPIQLTSSTSQGSPFTVFYKEDNQSDEELLLLLHGQPYYFEVTVTELDRNAYLSIGIVSPNEVQLGYGTRGMFYNGNLTNGGASLRTAFGPYVQQGSKVGILYDPSSSSSSSSESVYVYVNDQCLGLAFEIPKITTTATSTTTTMNYQRYPSLHAEGRVTLKWNVPQHLPSQRSKGPLLQITKNPFLGDWKLERLLVGAEPSALPLPDPHNMVATIKQQATTTAVVLDVSLKIGNIMSCPITLVSDDHDSDNTACTSTPTTVNVTVGGVRSTRMMPPPELRRVELELSQGLPTMTNMKLIDDDDDDNVSLVLSGPTMELYLHRIVEAVGEASVPPLTSYE